MGSVWSETFAHCLVTSRDLLRHSEAHWEQVLSNAVAQNGPESVLTASRESVRPPISHLTEPTSCSRVFFNMGPSAKQQAQAHPAEVTLVHLKNCLVNLPASLVSALVSSNTVSILFELVAARR